MWVESCKSSYLVEDQLRSSSFLFGAISLVVNDGGAHVRTPISVGHPHLTKIFKWLSKPNQSFNFKTARMGCRPRGALVSYRAIRCCVSPVDRNMKLNFFRDGGEHKFRWGWHKSRWGWHKMRWGCAHGPPPSGGSSHQMGVRPSDGGAPTRLRCPHQMRKPASIIYNSGILFVP